MTGGGGEERGLVFDLQRFAVHDGPGIRTLVFLKGCPLRCLWCANPESRHPRLELRHAATRCTACLSCAPACPHGAVSALPDGRPAFDRSACGECAAAPCVPACPGGALSLCGRVATAAGIAAEVARDAPFYRNSGGGVTFSGGEPFAQPAFLLALLAACKGLGIATAVETCGHADPAPLEAATPLVDLFLFDVKAVDPARHRALTGVGNEAILANLESLCSSAPGKVSVRVPLVPGVNDSDEDLVALCGLARRLGLSAVTLLPYHPFGRTKYAELGLPEPPAPPAPGPALVSAWIAHFSRSGVRCTVG